MVRILYLKDIVVFYLKYFFVSVISYIMLVLEIIKIISRVKSLLKVTPQDLLRDTAGSE